MKKGISLIVLVITIIIMIILAAAVIISINNTGVIRQANTAVDSKEEKEIQHLISLAWSEAYIQGNRTVEELEAAMEEKLQGVDLSDYEYTVTEKGAFVDHVTTRADKEAKKTLNKYGFYYDYGYTVVVTPESTDAEAALIASVEVVMVFRENGSAQVFASTPLSLGVLTCLEEFGPGECVYSKNQITLPSGDKIEVLNGGNSIMMAGMEMVCNYTVSSGVQRNFNYFGVWAAPTSNNNNTQLMPVFATISDDNIMTLTMGIENEMHRAVFKVNEIAKDRIFDVGELIEIDGEQPPASNSSSSDDAIVDILSDDPYTHNVYVSYNGKQIIMYLGENPSIDNLNLKDILLLEAQVDFVYTPDEDKN